MDHEGLLGRDFDFANHSSYIKARFRGISDRTMAIMSNSYIFIAFYALALAVLHLVIHRRFLHPLRNYPGPFIASCTNVWYVLLLTLLLLSNNTTGSFITILMAIYTLSSRISIVNMAQLSALALIRSLSPPPRHSNPSMASIMV